MAEITAAEPPISPFIDNIEPEGFRESPPLSKVIALPIYQVALLSSLFGLYER